MTAAPAPKAPYGSRTPGAFLEVADLVGDADDELANENVSAALAVLAGIAAADAPPW